MRTTESKKDWRRLDNVAKVFSLHSKNNTNVFRYSVILKEKINKKILEKALEKAINSYRAFKVKISSGFFWNYLEINNKKIIIQEESEIPCKRIDFEKNNDYLFKVTYFKNKINLDIFHVLTDGTGAIKFLKSIIYNYLSLKHNISYKEQEEGTNIYYNDQYLKNYNKNIEVNSDIESAYLIEGKVNKKINNTYHYITNIKDIKKVCKKYNVTITEYLTAIYIYSIYTSIYNKKSNKEIIIEVPINLRPYYEVDTLSNFFACMNINPKIIKNNNTKLTDILKEVKKEFKRKTEIDKVKSYLTRDVNLGMNIYIRLVPLFIKKLFIKYLGNLFSRSSTTTLSNVGKIEVDSKYEKYIDNILVLVMPGEIQKIKCTICSFNKNLNITINSNIDDINFEKKFYDVLKTDIKNITIKSNNNIDLIR